MNAEILTIGDELLIGQVINTNQAYIAEQLNNAGIAIARMTTVGDDAGAILEAFRQAWERVDIVIVTGGLGPTHDDITKRVVCTFFQTSLVPNEAVRRHIETLLARRNLQMSATTEEQALIPAQSTVLENPIGTAPGLLIEEGRKMFVVLPGVPYEMKAIVDRSLVPLLTARAGRRVIRHRTLRTTGISESLLARKLGDIEELVKHASLAFLPSPFGVRLRISVEAADEQTADDIVRKVEGRIRSSAERYVYGVGEEELEDALGKILAERHLTIAVAESCTGGLIGDRLTNVSGSSGYFETGIISYSNKSKIALLGVPAALIEQYGAVSKEVAEAMAEGVRRAAETDIGLSTTGIAGPKGGSAQKPVGLVWIGYADNEGVLAMKFNFGDERILVKQRASQAALELVRRKLLRLGE